MFGEYCLHSGTFYDLVVLVVFLQCLTDLYCNFVSEITYFVTTSNILDLTKT